MTENSVGDQPRLAPNGVVGDVVIPHHVERMRSRFAVVGNAENVGTAFDVFRCLIAADVSGFVERYELSLA